MAQGREYSIAKPTGIGDKSNELELLLCRLTGAQAAVVLHSYPGAIWLALTALAADREVLVARGEVAAASLEDSLPSLAASARAVLKEIGAPNGAATADYETAISPRVAAILMIAANSERPHAEGTSAEFEALIALARDRELLSVDALGSAPLVDPPTAIKWPRRSAQASIAAGADLVLLRGDGLVGGPSCCILLGTQDTIARIKNHPLFTSLKLEPFRAGALAATVECYDNPSRGSDLLPVWQCFTASIDNLRNRAERMAGQLAHAEGIATAMAVETRSPVFSQLAEGSPTYAVALTPGDGNVDALADRMRSSRFPVIGRVEGDRLVLDLRTVLPRQDKLIVDSFLGE